MHKEKEPDRYSISELGGWTWSDPIPTADDSGVVRRFHALHRVPVGRLGPADLRFLIGQNECLDHLVPKAISLLEADPWKETEYFPGDLLLALLQINAPQDHWRQRNAPRERMAAVVRRALDQAPEGTSRRDLRLLQAFLDQPAG